LLYAQPGGHCWKLARELRATNPSFQTGLRSSQTAGLSLAARL
jgi:hypothetical protein